MKAARFNLAMLALSVVAASASFATEDEHKEQSHPDDVGGADTPPIARRLWGELVCLCGRCEQLTFSACHCQDAAAERKKIVEMVRQHDLTTAGGQTAAHNAVVDAYVARFGRKVLASETSSEDWRPWLVLIATLVVATGTFVLIQRRVGKRTKPRRR